MHTLFLHTPCLAAAANSADVHLLVEHKPQEQPLNGQECIVNAIGDKTVHAMLRRLKRTKPEQVVVPQKLQGLVLQLVSLPGLMPGQSPSGTGCPCWLMQVTEREARPLSGSAHALLQGPNSPTCTCNRVHIITITFCCVLSTPTQPRQHRETHDMTQREPRRKGHTCQV